MTSPLLAGAVAAVPAAPVYRAKCLPRNHTASQRSVRSRPSTPRGSRHHLLRSSLRKTATVAAAAADDDDIAAPSATEQQELVMGMG